MLKLNLLYVHGYRSSGQSKTAEAIRAFLPQMADNIFENIIVLSPDIPEEPHDAILFVRKFVADNQIDCIVGSSLGAFVVINASLEARIPKIVINPLVDSMEILQVDLENPLVKSTHNIYQKYLASMLLPQATNLYAVFSTCDEVLNSVAQSKVLGLYYGCTDNNMVFVSDAHTLTMDNMKMAVCPLIMKALDNRY